VKRILWSGEELEFGINVAIGAGSRIKSCLLNIYMCLLLLGSCDLFTTSQEQSTQSEQSNRHRLWLHNTQSVQNRIYGNFLAVNDSHTSNFNGQNGRIGTSAVNQQTLHNNPGPRKWIAEHLTSGNLKLIPVVLNKSALTCHCERSEAISILRVEIATA